MRQRVTCKGRLCKQAGEADGQPFALALVFNLVKTDPQDCAAALDVPRVLLRGAGNELDATASERGLRGDGVETPFTVAVQVLHGTVDRNPGGVEAFE